MDSKYTSEELFHFVGHGSVDDHATNYQILVAILKSGCITHDKDNIGWGPTTYTVDWSKDLQSEELVVPAITCYAEIPRDSLDIHVAKYGKFGIGLPKDLLVRYGARPVMYIPMTSHDHGSPYGSELLRDIAAVGRAYEKLKNGFQSIAQESKALTREPINTDQAIKAMQNVFVKDFLAFVKPFNAELAPSHPDNFYMEREWRRLGNICFDIDDITCIVLEESFHEQFKQDFPSFKADIHIV